ncbi:MAG: hypothetical protein ACTSYM_00400 [Candidatus Baldrarchaeia archaeon]
MKCKFEDRVWKQVEKYWKHAEKYINNKDLNAIIPLKNCIDWLEFLRLLKEKKRILKDLEEFDKKLLRG